MNPEVKAQWLEALRSGKYRQGVAKLHTQEGGFCCLGVLCDLYAKAKGIEKPWTASGQHGHTYIGHAFLTPEGMTLMPPKEVYEWAGIAAYPDEDDDAHASGDNGGLVMDLSAMNDSGKSFDVIADYIETHL